MNLSRACLIPPPRPKSVLTIFSTGLCASKHLLTHAGENREESPALCSIRRFLEICDSVNTLITAHFKPSSQPHTCSLF